ncbi:two-pore potassium channel 3-like [Musa acuminata AAA Group]|uniref:two-pore potassium channel 3-like n=1 Tax=Musa acuminata AAA Group TaxID=214697 RepID=UPI0031DE7242
MEREPLLPIKTTSPSAASSPSLPSHRRKPSLPPSTPTSSSSFALCPLPEDGEISLPISSPSAAASSSLKDRLIFGFPSPADLHHDDAAAAALPPSSPPASPNAIPIPGSPGPNPLSSAAADAWLSDPSAARWKTNLHRSRTAPAMSAINEVGPSRVDSPGRPSIIAQAFLLLVVYLAFGVAVYTFNRHHFTAAETHPVVDALYFCIVTMCTIGYGDITPTTASAKIFSITFVIIGFGFVDILLSGMVSYVLDLQESLLLSAVTKPEKVDDKKKHKQQQQQDHHHHHHHRHEIARNYIIDVKKGRMRIRMKVALALGVVLLCIGLGTGVLRFVERLGWLDSFYLSVMSVTTVGYGDRAFKTMPGRLFASLWLLVSTLAVARAFLYLAEARIDKRHRKIAKWVLSRDMTVSEFLAADIDNNGFVTKSEFVIYKLKEMEKVTETDIMLICNQFDKLDTGKCGKITLSDLMSHH